LLGAALGALVAAGAAQASPIIVYDNGTPNHIDLPPGDYLGSSEIFEIGESAEGDWLDVGLRLRSNGSVETPGGALGGHVQTWTGAVLELTLLGVFQPYYRVISLPVQVVTNSAQRSASVPLVGQLAFAQEIRFLTGELTGDPDFDLLRVTGGTDLGMPSPGETTLEIPYDIITEYAVDGYFWFEHQIEIVGAAGGPFAGWGGTTWTMSQLELVGGAPIPEPALAGLVGVAALALPALARRPLAT
jgi:hypothetical protein